MCVRLTHACDCPGRHWSGGGGRGDENASPEQQTERNMKSYIYIASRPRISTDPKLMPTPIKLCLLVLAY